MPSPGPVRADAVGGASRCVSGERAPLPTPGDVGGGLADSDRAADFGWTEGKRVCSAHLLLEDYRVDVRAAHHDISSVTRGEGLQAVAV